jgi:hypothetical protein
MSTPLLRQSRVLEGHKPNPSCSKPFFAHRGPLKKNLNAQAAAEAASAPGCAFLFSGGVEIVKCVLKKTDFGWVMIY